MRRGKTKIESCAVNELPHASRNEKSDAEPTVLADVNRSTTELDILLKLFSRELFEKISLYTNMRLQLLQSEKPNGANMHMIQQQKK